RPGLCARAGRVRGGAAAPGHPLARRCPVAPGTNGRRAGSRNARTTEGGGPAGWRGPLLREKRVSSVGACPSTGRSGAELVRGLGHGRLLVRGPAALDDTLGHGPLPLTARPAPRRRALGRGAGGG